MDATQKRVEVLEAHKKVREAVVVLQTSLRNAVPKYNTLLISKEMDKLLRKVESLQGQLLEVL